MLKLYFYLQEFIDIYGRLRCSVFLHFQTLENRLCLSYVLQSPMLMLDVNGSTRVTVADALYVINELGRSGVLNDQTPDLSCDTNGDGRVSPIDALLVINALARYSEPLTLFASLSTGDDPNANGVAVSNSIEFTGSTLTGVRVDAFLKNSANIEEAITPTMSDERGDFTLSFPIAPGQNSITINATDPLGRTQSLTKTVRRGDILTDWNATVLNVVREWTTYDDDPYEDRIVHSRPPEVARNLAMIHTAMFDAINAIEGGYKPYLVGLPAPEMASPEAAAAAAAYRVAIEVYPDADEMAYWNATLAESLSIVPDGTAKEAGIVFGTQVGEAMLSLRANDGSSGVSKYAPSNEVGDWNRTYPNFLPPLIPHWRNVTPFGLNSPGQFRPDPPPAVSSQEYADAVDEVMDLGRLDSRGRTEDQTEIAIFWADGSGTFTPPGHWNQIAADVVLEQDNSLLENARIFALLNLALADAGISAWDAKYEYDLWRPIDAIQQGDQDGNSLTNADPTWLPLLLNPPFPTYTSGHSTFSGAADAVLTVLLGEDIAFTSQIDAQAAPGQRPLDPSLIVTREFNSFTEAAEEAGLSRIYGGIHFNFDNTAGLNSGRLVGTHVVSNVLKPTEQQT
ncbi:PAP2 superfamily protein [Stieleria magnilauensis]|uniref:PAP2 superfamily protein n=2 Tax=Stieleria magnilauensis TaxID=2527963 RepID=A0ABX5XL24_9BACT|nr:PAP2 superfamily protein [Planctomycetes bacterium TBK1r]